MHFLHIFSMLYILPSWHHMYTTVQFWLLLSEPYTLLSRHYLHCIFLISILQGLYPSSQALPLPWDLFLVTIFKPLCSSSQAQPQIYSLFLASILQSLLPLLSISGQYSPGPVSFLQGTTITLHFISGQYS